MKHGKWIFALALGFFFVVPSLFNAHAASEEPITLTYSTFFRKTTSQAQVGQAWAKEIERRTNQKVKIRYLPDASFLKGDSIYDGVVTGVADIGMSVFAYTPGSFPVMEAIDLPLGYPNGKVATSVINEFYRRFQPKELARVKVLYLHAHGAGFLHSKKPVKNPGDLKGMRIRSTSLSSKIVKALGAIPVALPQEETYGALRDNLVDATLSPMEVLKGWKQAEVVKYTVECYCASYTTGMYVLMNLNRWNGLPEEIRRVFEEVNVAWIPKHGEAWDVSDEEGRKYTLSLGNKVIHPSRELKEPWLNAIMPIVSEYTKEMGKRGLPGKEYVDAIRTLILEYSNKK
jgi:TRAP-type C4-dicarboxylate transport system substrate-binding protein